MSLEIRSEQLLDIPSSFRPHVGISVFSLVTQSLLRNGFCFGLVLRVNITRKMRDRENQEKRIKKMTWGMEGKETHLGTGRKYLEYGK